jgi:hypothetical protein
MMHTKKPSLRLGFKKAKEFFITSIKNKLVRISEELGNFVLV